MRLLAGYIFFLLTTLPLAAQEASWWYPLGNPEATRRVLGMMPAGATQDSSTLLVKWQSMRLANSPILLVGPIWNEGDNSRQEIVGMAAGSKKLTILSSGGRVLFDNSFTGVTSDPNASFELTGLFNTEAPSPLPFGRPNVIGLGIERTQSSNPLDTLNGVLVDSSGKLRRVLAINQRIASTVAANQRAGVYPVAAFRPPGATESRAVAIVTQDGFIGPQTDTMINSVLRFRLPGTGSTTSLEWRARFAPKGYEQQPAILDTGAGPEIYLAPSNATYRLDSAYTVVPPSVGNQTQTFSNAFYSYNLRVDESSPNVVQTVRIPRPEINPGVVPGRADSYYARFFTDESDPVGKWYQVSTENHSAEDTGVARIFVADATIARTGFAATYLNNNIRNIGWTIVAADVDGNDNSEEGASDLFRNKGDELVGAYRRNDGSDIDTNRLYVFRWNSGNQQPGQNFYMFASFPFSGRLIAAGDLISDGDRRHEILVANGNTLEIYQLRRYDDPDFKGSIIDRKPFRLISTIRLDSRIVNAVIADLEGDTLNDIIVSTMGATYAIGRAPLQPFGVITVSDTAFCQGDPAFIRWSRRAGSGEFGTTVLLRRSDGSTTTLTQPSGRPDSVSLPESLQPGRYRVIIQDPELPALVDSSRSFTVRGQSIGRLNFTQKPQAVGDTIIILGVPFSCVDGIQLESSYNRINWTRANLSSTNQTGTTVDAGASLPCPPTAACGALDTFTIYYRLANTDGSVTSTIDSATVHIAQKQIVVTPGTDTSRSRRRTIAWNRDDFSCDQLRITLQSGGRTVQLASSPRTLGSYDLEVPPEISGEVTIAICCDQPATACEFARTTIQTEAQEDANYIAPNPFDPETTPGGARVVYRLGKPGTVDITIYDASRAVVRRLRSKDPQEAGFHGENFWDGRNERGETVANGTYICVVESDTGERILLQMIVVKH